MDDYVISISIYLSNNETVFHNSVRLSEQRFFDLLNAHQKGKRFLTTADGKTICETSRIIAIGFSSPHVVGMEIRVLNKEPAV